MRHYWIGMLGCVDRCYYCDIRRDEVKCPDCLQRDIDAKRQKLESFLEEDTVEVPDSYEGLVSFNSMGKHNHGR